VLCALLLVQGNKNRGELGKPEHENAAIIGWHDNLAVNSYGPIHGPNDAIRLPICRKGDAPPAGTGACGEVTAALQAR
jgi:hypothetical protein